MFKNRKNMKEMVRISKMLIEGELELEKFLEILDTNQDLLNTFNKYAKKYLYTFFKNIKKLREDIKLSNDIHIFVYQLIQGFLWTKKVEFEIKASEYVFFNKMMKQCPEWFQCRFDLLLKMYDNLEDIIDAKNIAKKTLRIARENIIFALAIKFAILVYSVFLTPYMWLAIFADVGVSVLAILNATRALHSKKRMSKEEPSQEYQRNNNELTKRIH